MIVHATLTLVHKEMEMQNVGLIKKDQVLGGILVMAY